MASNAEEIVLAFTSRSCWNTTFLWEKFIAQLNEAVGSTPLKLDENDPLRREFKDYTLKENVEYICQFQPKETSKTFFLKYPKNKADLSATLYKEIDTNYNSLNIYLPSNESTLAKEIFELAIELLSPIYAYADYNSVIYTKRRADGYAAHPEIELAGVFWLTYFGKPYVTHFGASVFEGLSSISSSFKCEGICLTLASNPTDVAPKQRLSIESQLGELSFVNPDSSLLKPIGKYVPSFENM